MRIVYLFACSVAAFAQPPVGYRDTPMLPGQKWRVHDIDRPRPPSVTPAAVIGQPPSVAVVTNKRSPQTTGDDQD